MYFVYVKKARFLSTQAREDERFYHHKEIGYNYRMSNILAGIGRGQLIHLEEHILSKIEIYNRYKEAFKDMKEIEMNGVLPKDKSNYWLSCMMIKKGCGVKPIDIIIALEKENIESRHIWKPMHMQPIFKNSNFVGRDFVVEADLPENIEMYGLEDRSVGYDIFNRGLCLPSDIKMTLEDQDKIISIIKELF